MALTWALFGSSDTSPHLEWIAATINLGLRLLMVWQGRIHPNVKKLRQAPETTIVGLDGELELRQCVKRNTLLVLFRGTWCGYCMAQIEGLFRAKALFSQRGLDIVLVSNDPLSKLDSLRKKYANFFQIYSDPNLNVARHFNLVHEGGTMPHGRKANGADTTYPTAILVNERSEVIDVFDTNDYTIRPNPMRFIEAFDTYLVNSLLQKKVRDVHVNLAKTLEQKQLLLRALLHDLSSSLAVILTSAEFGNMPDIPVQQQGSLWEKVARAAQSQKEIIENVRRFEALNSGKITGQLQDVNFLLVLEHCEFLFKDRLAAKDLTLEYDRPAFDGLKVEADEVALKNQVFANLLSNAIKFSQAGSKISVEASQSSNIVEIRLKDTGVGMSKELISNLFDFSKPTSRVGTAGEKGTGFGLPLVKAYMDSFEGQISVTSEPNKGTTFCLRFKQAT